MWLLDVNMDVHLIPILNGWVQCDTATNRGWKALSNGDLVGAATSAGFTCLLTRDQRFGESAARALKAFPGFAVVVVDLPQLPRARSHPAVSRRLEPQTDRAARRKAGSLAALSDRINA
jgi:hypothetical protein